MFPIAGLVSGLFGGAQSKTAAAAGPVSQTVNTGAISLGSHYVGTGSVSSSADQASGGSTLQSPAANNTPLYVLAGVGVLVAALVVLRK